MSFVSSVATNCRAFKRQLINTNTHSFCIVLLHLCFAHFVIESNYLSIDLFVFFCDFFFYLDTRFCFHSNWPIWTFQLRFFISFHFSFVVSLETFDKVTQIFTFFSRDKQADSLNQLGKFFSCFVFLCRHLDHGQLSTEAIEFAKNIGTIIVIVNTKYIKNTTMYKLYE